ncbi:hypothetical protein COMNV_00151 [Commensalibacter sp. Nvir]|uniref:alpha/beta fold hydrolase n=1 Tax=Commensalibacter sp. Nvir TaxID=3069817 RepID=UPI002D6D9512|nr:hypothetical protein COMNV_00151 [Commensalibacter sp. Nvir]
MKLLFVHGWGYSKAFWKPLINYFEPQQFDLLDLGFFKNLKTTHKMLEDFGEHQHNYIVVGHSLGLMYVLNHFPSQFHRYIGINSFLCFVQKNDFKEGVPKRILEKMLYQITREPLKVLEEFYRRCGYKNFVLPSEEQLDVKQLRFGLQLLIGLDLRDKLKKIGGKLTVITSEGDPIVSKPMVVESFKDQKVQWLSDNTHLLPYTQPKKCADLIKEILRANG